MAKKSSMAADVAVSDSKFVPPEQRKSGWDDYEIRDSLRTLSQADKIRKNKPLMAAVRAEAKKQLTAAQATHATLQGGK